MSATEVVVPLAAASGLAYAMSEISEECWCARWLSSLWFMLTEAGPEHPWGMGHVSEEDIANLKSLSEKCGGWICWEDGAGETWISLEDWKRRADTYKANLDAWAAQRANP